MIRLANGSLQFEPFGVTNNTAGSVINHGLNLPNQGAILEMGVFTNGYLRTNAGRNVEAQRRKIDSFSYHLCYFDAGAVADPEPIRLYPNPEPNNLNIPDNLFLPAYNCHGFAFGDSHYWINPIATVPINGANPVFNRNIEVILEDEFGQVGEEEGWDVAIFTHDNGHIAHSLKRDNGIVYSKFDNYQLVNYNSFENVDMARYSPGEFLFYRCLAI